jgi:hypothetical protein
MLALARRSLSLGSGVALYLCTVTAVAEDDAATRQAARKLAEDGVAALQNGDTATAVQKLEKAHQMLKVPSVALWSARALIKRGQLVEAAERLRDAQRLPGSGDAAVQEQARRDAEHELAELTPRIPSLVISVENAEPQAVNVTLDGAVVPAALLGEERPVNPGAHRVEAARGAQRTSVEVTLGEAEHKEAKLGFEAPTAPSSAPKQAPPQALAARAPQSHTLAYVALGVGGAGLLLGGVTGALALGKKSSLDDDPACKDGQCTYAVQDDVSSLRTFRTVSTIGFVAGGALAATGIVLLVVGDSSTSAAMGAHNASGLALRLGPSSVRVSGSF